VKPDSTFVVYPAKIEDEDEGEGENENRNGLP